MEQSLNNLVRTIFYLLRSANLLYLGGSTLAFYALILYGYQDEGDLVLTQSKEKVPEPGHAVLIGYLAVQYLCLCKLFDGIARIAAGRELEPVPFTPVSIISPFLPLKYNIGLLLLGLALLPVALPLNLCQIPAGA